MEPDITLKVTTINGRYHARLLEVDGTVHSEMACAEKQDIGFCCQYLCRWYSKSAMDYSPLAEAARDRMSEDRVPPVGKIWYPAQLPINQR